MMNFTELFEDCTRNGRKIKKGDYLSEGCYPIIDQGQKQLIGFSNEKKGLYTSVPAIIFGDHTRIIKYIDEPFFIGADGVKILRCKDENANYRYLYYALKNVNIENTGYNRHYKWLKESKIHYPELKRQSEVAQILDDISSMIELKHIQLKEYDQLVKSRFVEMFGDPILNEMNWDIYTWNEVLTIKNGKNQKKVINPDGQYPICGSGGIMGYADDYLCTENSVIIGRKGSINKPILMKTKYWNVDTAFGLEPKNDKLVVNYLYLFCEFYDFMRHNKAVTIPSLTKGDLLKVEIPLPHIKLQNQFADFVQQVDKLKFAVQQSLDETQVLFDSLMQEYFG